ncbi:hypothetical protein K0M31_015101 [Melipona bicolor]|uniref:Uncharacterized protein n=1 Tax=Melipona bicolor TaxID=60889 RepID=A0AA40KFG4_9HYME|nr:hypothetical protein K0M31_015101 [Melipona bicolor]
MVIPQIEDEEEFVAFDALLSLHSETNCIVRCRLVDCPGYQSTNYQGGRYESAGSSQLPITPGPWARGYGVPHNYQCYPEYQQTNNYSGQQYGRSNYQNPQYNSYGTQYNQHRNYSSNYQGNSGGSGANREGSWRRPT